MTVLCKSQFGYDFNHDLIAGCKTPLNGHVMSKVNGDLYFQEASLLYAAHLGNQRKTKACKQLFFSFKICVFSSYHQNKILNWARGGQISDSEASEEKRG